MKIADFEHFRSNDICMFIKLLELFIESNIYPLVTGYFVVKLVVTLFPMIYCKSGI